MNATSKLVRINTTRRLIKNHKNVHRNKCSAMTILTGGYQFSQRCIETSAATNDVKSTDTHTSSKDIEKVLREKGHSVEDGFACISTPCFGCVKGKDGTMYINKVTGFYMCVPCQRYGMWENLLAVLNSKNKNADKGNSTIEYISKYTLKSHSTSVDGNSKWFKLIKSNWKFSSYTADKRKQLLSSFNLQEEFEETIIELDGYVSSDEVSLYFPLTIGDNIVGYKEMKKNGEEYCEPSNGCIGVIRYIRPHMRKKLENVVIVDSVRDLIALSIYKIPYQIICLPNGLSSLPQEVLPYLEQYSKIVLWFGKDAVSLDPTRTFCMKLGEQRCFFVRLTEDTPSPYMAHTLSRDVASIVKCARSVGHKSIITFEALREDVLSEIQNIDKARGVKWKRFPILNKILLGHRRGELSILTGSTGCGKTTFIGEYSLDLAMQGVTTLWGSFEIRNQRLAKTMMQQMVGVPLDKHLDNFNEWANRFQSLPIYFMTFHGPQSTKTVMEAVEHATYVHDIAHLVIDNVQFMMGLSSDAQMDRYYKQDTIIEAFRTFATQFNCHVTLIIHPRKEKDTDELTVSSIFGGVKASQEADNILIIQKKMLQSLHIKKYIQIVKNRYGGDLGVMPLVFDKNSLSFAPKKTNGSK